MALQDDYISDDVPEYLKEILQTKGIHREVLEVRTLKAVTLLATETIKSLKYQTWINLGFLIFGSLFTAFTSNLFDDKKIEAQSKLIHSQKTEIDSLKNDFQTYRYEMRNQLHELKNQIKNTKKQ